MIGFLPERASSRADDLTVKRCNAGTSSYHIVEAVEEFTIAGGTTFVSDSRKTTASRESFDSRDAMPPGLPRTSPEVPRIAE